MPSLSLRDTGLAVLDDVLTAVEFEAVCAEAEALRYRPARNYRTSGAWREGPGDPLEGPMILWPSLEIPAHIDVSAFDAEVALYPTGSARDRVLEVVKQALQLAPGLVGEEMSDWVALLGASWAYETGHQLQWHNDNAVYSGAFVYYCHRTWPDDAGGALVVADAAASDQASAQAGPCRTIGPRPNRLVLLKGGIWHQVLPTRGACVRRSVAGFFITPFGAVELLRSMGQSL